MTNVQQWVNKKYPTTNSKEQLREIIIAHWYSDSIITSEESKELAGKNLDLSAYPNLETIIIDGDDLKNPLTSLKISNCFQLKVLDCANNHLTDLDLSQNGKLESLYISDNNFSERDLSFLSHLVNLKRLSLGNYHENKIAQGIYNRFQGSLEFLKNLTELEFLDIENTDIKGGYQYLPAIINWTTNPAFEEMKVGWVKFFGRGENKQETEINAYQAAQKWISVGLAPEEASFAKWLETKNYLPEKAEWNEDGPFAKKQQIFQLANKETLQLEYNSNQWALLHPDFAKKYGSKTYQQKWEEASFSHSEAAAWITIGFTPNDWTIVPEWVNHGFAAEQAQEWIVSGSGNCLLAAYARTKGYLANKINKQELQEKYDNWANQAKNAQECLDVFYPIENRKNIQGINVSKQNLTGHLIIDGTDWIQLKEIRGFDNQLTKLTITNCLNLTRLDCSHNQLTITDFLSSLKPEKLTYLNLSNNSFPEQDLSCFSHLVNLEWLNISNNFFTGDLRHLNSMKKLKILNVSATDLNKVDITKLPKSLEEIYCSTEERLDCKITAISLQLEKCKHGFCQKCQQPNTSETWCQSCQEKEWKGLSGQKLVEKFAEKQREREYPNEPRWISYESFTNIEYLATGGSGKVYKAKWEGEKDYYQGLDHTEVALKFLSGSQNITLEFLREITSNILMFIEVIQCYGISQDPITNNYVIVMEYSRNGNLREHLQNEKENEKRLKSLLHKISKLHNIILSLNRIHKQNLIHCDLHSGNILGSRITDLGLCIQVNLQKEKGKPLGVLPYMAPEVLQEQPYSKASDIYSFGIVAYELFANAYPYFEYQGLSETELGLKICQGLRPQIEQVPIPQLLKDLIKQCWYTDPKKRLKAGDLNKVLLDFWESIRDKRNSEFYQQYQEVESEYNHWAQKTPYQIHSNAITTSKLINTGEIVRLLGETQLTAENTLQVEVIEQIEKEITAFKEPLTSQLKGLIDDFISFKKTSLKNKNKELKQQVWELEEKLENEGLVTTELEKLTKYCHNLVNLEQQQSKQLQTRIEIPTNNYD